MSTSKFLNRAGNGSCESCGLLDGSWSASRVFAVAGAITFLRLPGPDELTTTLPLESSSSPALQPPRLRAVATRSSHKRLKFNKPIHSRPNATLTRPITGTTISTEQLEDSSVPPRPPHSNSPTLHHHFQRLVQLEELPMHQSLILALNLLRDPPSRKIFHARGESPQLVNTNRLLITVCAVRIHVLDESKNSTKKLRTAPTSCTVDVHCCGFSTTVSSIIGNTPLSRVCVIPPLQWKVVPQSQPAYCAPENPF